MKMKNKCAPIKPLWELIKKVKSPIFKDNDPKPRAARKLELGEYVAEDKMQPKA